MRTTWYGWNFFGTLSLVIYLVKVITDYSVHNSLYQLQGVPKKTHDLVFWQ